MSSTGQTKPRRLKWLWTLVPALLLVGFLGFCVKDSIRKSLVKRFTPEYEAQGDASQLQPVFTDLDAQRDRVAVQLAPVASGISQATDIQFPPGSSELMFVTEKTGGLRWFNLRTGDSGLLAQIQVTVVSEQGLLGLAFHPNYASNGLIFINRTIEENGGDVSVIESRRVTKPMDPGNAELTDAKRIMSVSQPYQNHNAGGLAFGPDGMLYVGWGDGGWMDDPLQQGQNGATRLGSMLRINVDQAHDGNNFGIPTDNPFLGDDLVLPETWAIGLRNPWKICFAPDGRLIIADVGQNLWEEITLAPPGANLGWNLREGDQCFPPDSECSKEGLVDPIYTYGRKDGASVTGGAVHSGHIDQLKDKYLFGDFITGRIWAIDVPGDGGKSKQVLALGKWPILISTFGRDAGGEVYVADFAGGVIYRINQG